MRGWDLLKQEQRGSPSLLHCFSNTVMPPSGLLGGDSKKLRFLFLFLFFSVGSGCQVGRFGPLGDFPETDKYQWENIDDTLTGIPGVLTAPNWISSVDEGDPLRSGKP